VGPSCQWKREGGAKLSACAAREGKEARMACWADQPGGLRKELGRARGVGKDLGLRAENRAGEFFFFFILLFQSLFKNQFENHFETSLNYPKF